MKFNDFLDEIESGNSSLYMTTQDLEYSEEGEILLLYSTFLHLFLSETKNHILGKPSIASAPCAQLMSDFPLR